jgi:hypothetical protein
VADCVVLEHELTRHRRIGVERGGPIELLVAECPDWAAALLRLRRSIAASLVTASDSLACLAFMA